MCHQASPRDFVGLSSLAFMTAHKQQHSSLGCVVAG